MKSGIELVGLRLVIDAEASPYIADWVDFDSVLGDDAELATTAS